MRIAIVNLFYPPDLAPSGHHAASVAEHRVALGDDVTVVSGTGEYVKGVRSAGAARDGRGRPRIARIWTPGLGKERTSTRLIDYLAFLGGATVRLAAMPAQDVVVALTSPPYALLPAVVHRLLHPEARVVLWSHDLYPDAAEALGTLRPGGIAARALRRLQRWLVRYVDHVVAVDGAMLDRLVSGYARDGSPTGTVIPTWEPVALFPRSERPPPWDGYRDPELAGRFVVLHLGNLGMGHRTDTIADAAAALAGEDVVVLVVGGGVRVDELARAAAGRGARNIVFRGYVPKERTPAVLAGAGCTLISLDDRSRGIMGPSKMNPSLAMGVPVVYAGPTGTNVDDTIERFRCGFSVRQGDVRGIVDAIRRIRDDAALAQELSRNARRAFEEGHSDERALPRFDEVLSLVTAPAD